MTLQAVVLICFAGIVAMAGATYFVVRDLATGLTGRRKNVSLTRSRAYFDAPPGKTLTAHLDRAFDRLLWETGWELSPTTGFLILIASGLAIGGGLWLYLEEPLVGILGAAAGMGVALVVFIVQRRRRMQTIAEALPHLCDLLGRAVRAGRSIDQAIQFAGRELGGPLGSELQRCSKHLEMGSSVAMAMDSLAVRVRLPELRMLASVLAVHRRSGGQLPTALERMSGVARERLNYRRQMRSQTAAGRTSAMIVGVLGPVLFAVFLAVRPDHLEVLFENPTGQVLLTTAVVLQLVGLLWVARLAKARNI